MNLININDGIACHNNNYPPKEIIISFWNLKKPHLNRAINFAKNNTEYTEEDGLHSAKFQWRDQKELAFELLNIIFKADWYRKLEVIIDGVDQNIQDHKTSVRFVFQCFMAMKRDFIPETYCQRDGMPCQRIDCNLLTAYKWYHGEYGFFDENLVFHFDKRAIMIETIEAIDKVKYCPAFNIQPIIKAFNKIPDKIDPKTNKNWSYIKDPRGEIMGVQKILRIDFDPSLDIDFKLRLC